MSTCSSTAPSIRNTVPRFDALIFTVTASGYEVRCALEEDDSADIRHEKLCRLIRESDKSIHDLSRVELGKNHLPRFNMPYELGLTHGAHQIRGAPAKDQNCVHHGGGTLYDASLRF